MADQDQNVSMDDIFKKLKDYVENPEEKKGTVIPPSKKVLDPTKHLIDNDALDKLIKSFQNNKGRIPGTVNNQILPKGQTIPYNPVVSRRQKVTGGYTDRIKEMYEEKEIPPKRFREFEQYEEPQRLERFETPKTYLNPLQILQKVLGKHPVMNFLGEYFTGEYDMFKTIKGNVNSKEPLEFSGLHHVNPHGRLPEKIVGKISEDGEVEFEVKGNKHIPEGMFPRNIEGKIKWDGSFELELKDSYSITGENYMPRFLEGSVKPDGIINLTFQKSYNMGKASAMPTTLEGTIEDDGTVKMQFTGATYITNRHKFCPRGLGITQGQ